MPPHPDLFRVGLTGNIASGKSSVAAVWERLGAPLIDADVLARRAVEPGSPGLERVRNAFGGGVIREGALDRAAMRRIVFSDLEARRRLEAIVHPEVDRLRRLEEAAVAERGADVVVHDIPLLFEVGLEHDFDVIVLVDAPEEVRSERLVRDRGLSPDEARELIRSQMPSSGKRGRADLVIDNAGTLEQLEREARRVWDEVLRRADARTGGAAPGLATGAGRALPSTGGASAYGRVFVDMHVHTRLSFDSLNPPDAVVERAIAEGLHRVCITDHNEIEAALDLAERFPDRVIPGEEVKTAEGVDVIGLFLSEWIPKATPARETCERIHDQGGLVYVPHPFAPGKGGGGRILDEIGDLVDAVEGFNARLHDPALNGHAQEWARARDLPLGAGSDAHTLREIGRGRVELPPFRNDPTSFLAALRRGTIHGRTSSRLVHLASTLAKLVP